MGRGRTLVSAPRSRAESLQVPVQSISLLRFVVFLPSPWPRSRFKGLKGYFPQEEGIPTNMSLEDLSREIISR